MPAAIASRVSVDQRGAAEEVPQVPNRSCAASSAPGRRSCSRAPASTRPITAATRTSAAKADRRRQQAGRRHRRNRHERRNRHKRHGLDQVREKARKARRKIQVRSEITDDKGVLPDLWSADGRGEPDGMASISVLRRVARPSTWAAGWVKPTAYRPRKGRTSHSSEEQDLP